jgi:hypothetical protein
VYTQNGIEKIIEAESRSEDTVENSTECSLKNLMKYSIICIQLKMPPSVTQISLVVGMNSRVVIPLSALWTTRIKSGVNQKPLHRTKP